MPGETSQFSYGHAERVQYSGIFLWKRVVLDERGCGDDPGFGHVVLHTPARRRHTCAYRTVDTVEQSL